MATRRLIQRPRTNENSSPAQRSRQQSSVASRSHADQAAPLPRYEPPSCPLSATARQELSHLNVNYDYTKYAKIIETCKRALSANIADAYDRVRAKQEAAEVQTNRRRKQGGNDNEKTEEEIAAIQKAKDLEAEVLELRTRAEKAVRELVDFEDELNMNDSIMKEVIEEIPPRQTQVPPPNPSAAARNSNGDGDSDDDNAAKEREFVQQVPDEAGVSTLDILKRRREDYLESYASKSMRTRYENTDYATFIRTVHTSQYGDDVPVPHARTWFDTNTPGAKSKSSRRRTGAAEDDDSDDEVEISRASAILKCPFTLQYFVEPYSNKLCTHTFEKEAILDYYKNHGKHHDQKKDGRGRNIGPAGLKKVECPQSGCEQLLHPDDFYLDDLKIRQVKRAKAEEAREDDESESDEENSAPRGTQRNRPEELDSGDDDDVEVEEDEADRKRRVLKIKQERAQSRGVSVIPSQAFTDVVDLDDEDEDDEGV